MILRTSAWEEMPLKPPHDRPLFCTALGEHLLNSSNDDLDRAPSFIFEVFKDVPARHLIILRCPYCFLHFVQFDLEVFYLLASGYSMQLMLLNLIIFVLLFHCIFNNFTVASDVAFLCNFRSILSCFRTGESSFVDLIERPNRCLHSLCHIQMRDSGLLFLRPNILYSAIGPHH
jgi:hypothetical protein